MATTEFIRNSALVLDVHPSLFAFEARSLCLRLSECEAVVLQAIRGACEARATTCDAPELVGICEALEASLEQIVLAKRIGH
jgi:hypothetical protein